MRLLDYLRVTAPRSVMYSKNWNQPSHTSLFENESSFNNSFVVISPCPFQLEVESEHVVILNIMDNTKQCSATSAQTSLDLMIS